MCPIAQMKSLCVGDRQHIQYLCACLFLFFFFLVSILSMEMVPWCFLSFVLFKVIFQCLIIKDQSVFIGQLSVKCKNLIQARLLKLRHIFLKYCKHKLCDSGEFACRLEPVWETGLCFLGGNNVSRVLLLCFRCVNLNPRLWKQHFWETVLVYS